MTNPIDDTAPQDVEQLEDQLSTPSEAVVEAMGRLDGDLMLLGAGGKMGPTMARMAKRASVAAGNPRRVIAVSRFSSPAARERLEQWDVETVACDLLDEQQIMQLPDAAHVIFMTGMKFGTSSQPELTWAMNCYLPSLVCKRFSTARMAVFSSGNIYGLTPVTQGGSRETDTVRPVGEYSMTVLGRERVFSYFSRTREIPMVVLRLNYATELRYGVLVDIARQVYERKAVDVSMGWVNVIWQSEANGLTLQALTLTSCPPRVLNLAGPEMLRVRDVAERFGQLLDRPVEITGEEADDALLSNAQQCHQALGRPKIDAEQMMRWTADWIARDGDSLDKPTHFQSRSGTF